MILLCRSSRPTDKVDTLELNTESFTVKSHLVLRAALSRLSTKRGKKLLPCVRKVKRNRRQARMQLVERHRQLRFANRTE